MNLDDFHFLLSSDGQHWLQETAVTPITAQNHLKIAEKLRRALPASRAQAVLETVLLRQKAATKFSRAAEMYFTRAALEQASGEVVTSYRAQRFARAGYNSFADLGCGIGGDALALAELGPVQGVDWNMLRLALAQENLRVSGLAHHFSALQADLHALTPFAVEGLFFDPARRDDHGRRFYSVHRYQPPLSLIERWQPHVRGTAVKISPGVDYGELPAAAEVEFISLAGEVKECLLWLGELNGGVGRRATLLPGGESLTLADDVAEPPPPGPPQAYLYEPDRAVIRAHLVTAVAHQLNATRIDATIAYLTAATAQATPFARCYAIEDTFPFQLKRLRHYLREHQIGDVTIKKRGSPLEPDRLKKSLRLRGPKENHRILFLTHVLGEAVVIVGRRIQPA